MKVMEPRLKPGFFFITDRTDEIKSRMTGITDDTLPVGRDRRKHGSLMTQIGGLHRLYFRLVPTCRLLVPLPQLMNCYL